MKELVSVISAREKEGQMLFSVLIAGDRVRLPKWFRLDQGCTPKPNSNAVIAKEWGIFLVKEANAKPAKGEK